MLLTQKLRAFTAKANAGKSPLGGFYFYSIGYLMGSPTGYPTGYLDGAITK